MFDVSDAHRFRKTVAGLCMIMAPVLFIVATLVAPGFDRDEGAFAALIAESPDAFATSQVLLLGGWALFLCAVLGVMHMLRERGVAEGHIGGGLAIVGILAAVGQAGLSLAVWQAGSVETMTALLTNVSDSSLATVVLFALPLAITAGGIVLAWGLYRQHFAPAWMAGAIGLSAAGFAVGSLAASQAIFLIAGALLLVGLGSLGMHILGESTEDWDHTREYSGFGAAH